MAGSPVTESLGRAHCMLVCALRPPPVPEGSSVLLQRASRWTMWTGDRDGDGHRSAHRSADTDRRASEENGEELRGSTPAPGAGARSRHSQHPRAAKGCSPPTPTVAPQAYRTGKDSSRTCPLHPTPNSIAAVLPPDANLLGPACPQQGRSIPPHRPPEPGPPGALCPTDPLPQRVSPGMHPEGHSWGSGV